AQAALADPVKAAPNCHGTEPPFDKIYSMSVGLQEWDDSVVGDAVGGVRSGIRGGSYGVDPKAAEVEYCAELHSRILIGGLGTDVGFRCCGD
ncbi:MAG: hypothetical protein IT374_25425, partial [Polyangiaceae bacterium]|nr:hypothetical protein [Polyangiaceae bacterium]